MSQFLTPLILEMLPDHKFRLHEEFEYWTDISYQDIMERIYVKVPKGFETDLASVPRILWPLLPPHGEYGKAAVLHDYCYTEAIGNKKWADKIFLEAMEVLGVPKWKRILIYYPVKWFGKGNY